MKLWQKQNNVSEAVDKFTIGKDRELDLYLAPFDVLGSIAHITMLEKVGLIPIEDFKKLIVELKEIYKIIEEGKFSLEENVEDIHSQIEILLTRKLGEAGKKIHSARSRNDQVLLDIKLYLRNEIEEMVSAVDGLFKLLIAKSEENKEVFLPGYTHLQLAMPSSFGLWFGAYAEGLADDLITLHAAYEIVNKNPLGSAAGYGSSFPIDRQMTTELLGFSDLNYNVVYAQMGRGKAERITASALSNIAATLSKLSMDACLFMNQNFAFISFPDELTTGSSIMPHKKNPDVFELVRSYANRIQALPNEISLMTINLPSGYHRDLQLLKEHLFPAFETLKDCMAMLTLMFENIIIKKDIINDEKYQYLFSVEEVNKLVLKGMSFRDAYKNIGTAIESGEFKYDTNINHTHIGSIGNLRNDSISEAMENIINRFEFKKVRDALHKLLA